MKCDLHVHTTYSGMCTVPLMKAISRESYAEPEAVYENLKRQGMHLVTITDHDAIGALDRLGGRPDFFLSEEVTCRLPSGAELHMGIYDITERHHFELQRRREDFERLLAYLNEHRIFFSANHVFSRLTGRRAEADFDCFEAHFPGLETLNGCMPADNNRGARLFAERAGIAPVGGSDAHTVRSAGTCWTAVDGARTKAEFLAGLRAGAGRVHGSSGTYWKLTRDVLEIGCLMMRDNPYTAPMALLSVAVPAVTLVNYCLERLFSRSWTARLEPKYSGAALAREMAA